MTIDAANALVRAIRGAFPPHVEFSVEEIASRSWASATFAGARHELVFTLAGEGADACASAFLANLDVADFPVHRHLLADVALVYEERREGLVRIKLEALTIEEG